MSQMFSNVIVLGLALLAIGACEAFVCPSHCSCTELQPDNHNHAKCTSLEGLRQLGKTSELYSLDLSSLNLTKITNQLEKFTSLTILNLHNNHLSEINSLSLKRIRTLNLSWNRITSGKLSKIPAYVKHLNLSHNDITILTENFKRFVHLESFELADNPLNCTCETLEIRDWLQEKKIWTNAPILCTAPLNYKGRPWLQVPQSDVCDSNDLDSPRMLPYSEDENDLMMADDPSALSNDAAQKSYIDEDEFLPVFGNSLRHKRQDVSEEDIENISNQSDTEDESGADETESTTVKADNGDYGGSGDYYNDTSSTNGPVSFSLNDSSENESSDTPQSVFDHLEIESSEPTTTESNEKKNANIIEWNENGTTEGDNIGGPVDPNASKSTEQSTESHENETTQGDNIGGPVDPNASKSTKRSTESNENETTEGDNIDGPVDPNASKSTEQSTESNENETTERDNIGGPADPNASKSTEQNTESNENETTERDNIGGPIDPNASKSTKQSTESNENETTQGDNIGGPVDPNASKSTKQSTESNENETTERDNIGGPIDPNASNAPSKTNSNGTYILLAILLIILVLLILYVAAKRNRSTAVKNRRSDNDVESPAQEMLAMDKKNLGKPVPNQVEFIPLIPEKNATDKKSNLANAEEPLLQKLSEAENENDQSDSLNETNEPQTATKQMNGNAKPSQNGLHNEKVNSNGTGDEHKKCQSISPKPSRYSPVYAHDTGRVKIRVTETTRPKTPILVTRSRSNAGDDKYENKISQ